MKTAREPIQVQMSLIMVKKSLVILLTSVIDSTSESSLSRSHIIVHFQISYANDARTSRHVWNAKCCKR